MNKATIAICLAGLLSSFQIHAFCGSIDSLSIGGKLRASNVKATHLDVVENDPELRHTGIPASARCRVGDNLSSDDSGVPNAMCGGRFLRVSGSASIVRPHDQISTSQVVAVPEPSTLMMLGAGVLGTALTRLGRSRDR